MTIADKSANSVSTHRRRDDDPATKSRRIGVIWSADAHVPNYRSWSTVLDISPSGAKLQTDMLMLGEVDSFRLDVPALGAMECAPVWQRGSKLGVRFLSGQPTMARLRELVGLPAEA
jgi:hypothetical protein